MNTDRIVRLHGDAAEVVYSDGTKLVIGDKSAGQTTDEFHSFDDLYRHRLLLTAALFNSWYDQDRYDVHRSRLHSDGKEPFGGGWFIVVAQLPTGQISYHYLLKDWELFQIPELYRAAHFDGHTAAEAADRLEALLRS